MMKSFGLGYKRIDMCQAFTCCTNMKMHICFSAEPLSIPVINPKLVREGLLLHIENSYTS
jgi:hypothetical protein